MRELKEETGYIGKVAETEDGLGISCIMFNDPGMIPPTIPNTSIGG